MNNPLSKEAHEAIMAEAAKSAMRQKIQAGAGDVLSMLGTTADSAALSTLGIAALTKALAGASDFTEFKEGFLGALANLSGEQDMVAISEAFLQKIADGEVVIPAMAKGIGEVMADIEKRSTVVSEALVAVRSG